MCLTLGMFSETERKYNASSGPGETTHRDLTSSYLITSCTCSIHKLLELLHRECLHCLGCRLALKTQGSFVNGFTPFRAGVAGFDFSFRFSMPAILNEPVFFNSVAATPNIASTAPFTADVFKP